MRVKLGLWKWRIWQDWREQNKWWSGGCGVHLKSRTVSAELNSRLGIEYITDAVRQSKLRWFGHEERKDSDDWISASGSFEAEGVRNRGRGRNTCDEYVKKDLVELNLHKEWALDRVRWRYHMEKPSNSCKHGQRLLNGDDDDDCDSHFLQTFQAPS